MDRWQRITVAERIVLESLGPHTRIHALHLLSHFPDLTLTSGRRTAARNAAVGGSRRSYHLRGRAVDAVGPPDVLRRAATFARTDRVGSRCTGPEEVLVHDNGSGLHLHVAW